MKLTKVLLWSLFTFFAVAIGLYPLFYALVDMKQGLLGSKPEEVLQNHIWVIAFYTHIGFGGVSLLTGFTQFSKKLRNKKLRLHRILGKIYLLSVMLSGTAGMYIAIYATGGTISEMGFGSLAILWLFSSVMAFKAIRERRIENHRDWMIRSYALAFAAVTLRLWLPFMQFGLKMDFISAYLIVAWLCWVPNLIFAEAIIRTNKRKPLQSS